MFSYRSNKETFREDESDQSKMYQQKVNNWAKSWEHNLTKEEIERINKEETKCGKIYVKMLKRIKKIIHIDFMLQPKEMLLRI